MKNILRLKPLSIIKDQDLKTKHNSLTLMNNEIDKLTSSKKQILKFNLDNISSTFEYHGLKIIVCDEPDIFVRNLLNKNESYSNVYINDHLVRNKNIFHIHAFSKISDFINNKNNGLLHNYLKSKDIEKNNLEFEDFITQKYFDFHDNDLEQVTDIDLSKSSILDYISVNSEYINNENIFNLLNIIKDSDTDKKLVIINDYKIINIENIIKNYLDSFNFLIITNDLKKWMNDFRFVECIIIINKFINDEFRIDALEILDKQILIKYLEKILKKYKQDNKEIMNEILCYNEKM